MTMKLRRFDSSTSFKNKKGSSYIKLPKELCDKKAYVNVKNTDNQCFKYAIISALHLAKHNPDRISHYKPYLNRINWSALTFPVRVN